MGTWVALLRGVNVGGHRRLPMADLRAVLGAAGFAAVRTYVASGNVVLSAVPTMGEAEVAAAVAERIAAAFDLAVEVAVRGGDELADVAARHPFATPGAPPSTLHVGFLVGAPRPGALGALDPDRSPPDRLAPGRREVFLSTPDGLGRSRVLDGVERRLGTALTVRTLATVSKLVEMCG